MYGRFWVITEDKTEAESHCTVVRLLMEMRRDGVIPFD
jgi:hypothetical protein